MQPEPDDVQLRNMSSSPNRWLLAGAAVLMQVCLGIIYAWSVFRAPLEQHYGWSKTESIAPYRWSILFFTLAMIVAGFWQDKKGPRLVGSVGGLLLAAGCLLAAFIGNTPMGLNIAYGVVAGLGVGFAYVTPIATCVKWFPDKRGMVVGMAVMGFGIGSLIFAPLLEALLGKDPTRYAETLPNTFLLLAAIFLIVVTGCAQLYKVPPAGWKPDGWTPPVSAAGAAAEWTPREMLRSPSFWVLWVVYFLGSSVGLTAIGESSPLVRELAGTAAVMSGGGALGVMSLFNGVGRLAWGAASDRIGKQKVVYAMFAISIATCALLLPATRDFWRVLAGICLVGFCYGGHLALMPSLCADYFGSKNIGANYGILFTAWGAAGFTIPRYIAAILEEQKKAGAVAEGYNQMFYTLAVIAAVGLVAGYFLKKPVRT
ncbi:MAG: OFA family MFS transporter [Acidobacteria bacterium]|nr:OFA family MFS transporter [Acidobacteriota bacterium]